MGGTRGVCVHPVICATRGTGESPQPDAPDTLKPASWTSQGPHRPSRVLSISLDSRLVLFWTLSLTDGRDLSRCKPNMSLPLSPPLGAPGEQTPQTVLLEITRRWQGGDSREALDMAGAWEPDGAARGMNASGPAASPAPRLHPAGKARSASLMTLTSLIP